MTDTEMQNNAGNIINDIADTIEAAATAKADEIIDAELAAEGASVEDATVEDADSGEDVAEEAAEVAAVSQPDIVAHDELDVDPSVVVETEASLQADGKFEAIADTLDVEVSDSNAEAPDVKGAHAKTPKKLDFSYTQNRELSWLQFDRRVLEEALDPTVPLFERLKFISIFSTNLDEFFMVRVGSLTDLSIIAPDIRDNKTNMTPSEQLEAIFAAVKPLIKMRDEVYDKVTSKLRKRGFKELDLTSLSKKERRFARDYYREFVRPVLSPQVVDERHPFPHLRNKDLYVVTLLTEEDGSQHLGIVPIPDNVPPVIFDPENTLHFVRTEKLIAHYISKIFDIYETSNPAIICVTRNADISFDEEKFSDDEGDYRLHVSRLLKKRYRLNPVRLEVEGDADKTLINGLLKRLKLSKDQVYTYKAPINLGWVFGWGGRVTPEMRTEFSYPSFVPRVSREFESGRSIIEQVEERDRLLFYPYDSIDPFLRMLFEAAHDPEVISIKITVYRLASESRVAAALAEAAENGKEVTVLMELRARFDEANNIDWAARLEEAGCNIIYGMENYKCHSKVCLITKRNPDGVTSITQIGTGNYNEKTARLYTDLSLITADEEIGRDAAAFFQNMQIGNLKGDYECLLVAPKYIKRTILKLIDREIAKGEAGRITFKANSLTERDIIDKLVEASQAGVQVRMNIRGICCMRPGLKGKTENIHVRSIVGQFLEHSRIFVFGEGDDLEMFIGSADLMTRNLVHRVEVATPIKSERARKAILLFLDKIFADNVKARMLQSDGEYVKISANKEDRFCLHDWCIEHPLQDAERVEPDEFVPSIADEDESLDIEVPEPEVVEVAEVEEPADLAELAVDDVADPSADSDFDVPDEDAAPSGKKKGKKDKKKRKDDGADVLKTEKLGGSDDVELDIDAGKLKKGQKGKKKDKTAGDVKHEKAVEGRDIPNVTAAAVEKHKAEVEAKPENTEERLERERDYMSDWPHTTQAAKETEKTEEKSVEKTGEKSGEYKPQHSAPKKKGFFSRLFS